MDGSHVERVPEKELDAFASAQVSEPIPGEDALDTDDEVVGCDGLEESICMLVGCTSASCPAARDWRGDSRGRLHGGRYRISSEASFQRFLPPGTYDVGTKGASMRVKPLHLPTGSIER